jgi:hypothetical protein
MKFSTSLRHFSKDQASKVKAIVQTWLVGLVGLLLVGWLGGMGKFHGPPEVAKIPVH